MRPFYTPHQLRHDQDDILFINEHWGEIKEAYFQVLEALKAPSVETPETPTPEGGCKCSWVKKTLIPTYFYITLDSTAEGLTDSDVEEIIKNTDVTVTSDGGSDIQSGSIPKQFPLMYLGKTAKGYKYAFPYSMDDSQDDTTNYDIAQEKCIVIQLHNRLSQYNTENSSFMHGLTKTNGTRIYRDSYGGGGKWPATNKIILSLAAEDCTIYSDLTSDIPQDTAKVYYYKHIANEIEPVPMTFEFLETVRQYTTEVEDKPEDTPEPPETPDYTTPEGVVEGVLTKYVLKVRFTNASDDFYKDPGRFSIYYAVPQKWKAATKIVDDVVYYVFTEEEVRNGTFLLTKHPPMPIQELTLENAIHVAYVELTFDDSVQTNNVITINTDDGVHRFLYVGSAYI